MVPIDGIIDPVPLDSRSDDGSVEASDRMANDFRTTGAGTLLHVIELDDLTFGETSAKVLDHGDFHPQGNGVDASAGLSDHKGGDFQTLGIGSDDVCVVHNKRGIKG